MALSVRSALQQSNGVIRLLEAHDRLSTDIIRKTNGPSNESFEGIWISGLTQTTYLGIPDTEIVSPLYRAILQATNVKPSLSGGRPLCAAFDADSGGPDTDIPALVAVLLITGVSMVIIEDKEMKVPGNKVNSLLSANGSQSQADPAEFCKTIQTFKKCAEGTDLMVTARIESFNVRIVKSDPTEEAASVKASLQDALSRAKAYKDAGADSIMIHSKSHSPVEVLEFLRCFREIDRDTPLVVVPTTYSTTPRKTLIDAGANIIIYANHLIRAKINAVEGVIRHSMAYNPDLFVIDKEASTCVEARNYGCLLRILRDKDYWTNGYGEITGFLHTAQEMALDNMKDAAMELAMGMQSGCEADGRIISVRDLLKVNSVQVSNI